MLCCLFSFQSVAQISINTDNSDPDPSAILDIKSTDKGILIPRMTAAERDAIASPVQGLMVFVTDDNSFHSYDGSAWFRVNTQWKSAGNDIFFDEGNVGIGTDSPSSDLEISDSEVHLKLRSYASGASNPANIIMSNAYRYWLLSGPRKYTEDLIFFGGMTSTMKYLD